MSQNQLPGLARGKRVLVRFDRIPPYIGEIVEVEPDGNCLVTTPDPLDPIGRFPTQCLFEAPENV